MLTFRWFILRLFWSLLLLPLAAYPLLWLLHEAVSSGIVFDDTVAIFTIWILLFVIVSLTLSRFGASRFALLEKAGHEAITQNRPELAEKILADMQKLFSGGLLSGGFQQKNKRRLLRQYFSFYAAQPEKVSHREHILDAVRENICAKDGYAILKNYVLQQPALTLPVIDLVDELLEREPDDGDLLEFMTRQYLRERQTHFRAEHIFSQYLSRNGTLVPEIVSMCLDRLLSRQAGRRQDEFAIWCYLRAFQHGEEKNSVLRQLLHEIHQRFQRSGRHDTLANAVTAIATEFTPEEIAGWAIARQEKQTHSLRFRAARIFFHLQQKILKLYSRLRERRAVVYGIAGAVLVLSVSYFIFFDKRAKIETQAISAPPEDSTRVYYALQIGAMRSIKTAEREAEQWRRRGLEVHVLKPEPSQRLHRLRIGKYRSKQAAQIAADSLKAVGIVRDCFIAEYEKQ
jgi:hypothetical protein